jgi:shikimate kinase
MNKKQLKALEKITDSAVDDAIMGMYRTALDQCDEIYTAMLLKMRERINNELKKKGLDNGVG